MTTATPAPLVRERRGSSAEREWVVPVVTLVCGAVLALAWQVRDELFLGPDRGLGYALGITGLSLLTLLLGYSLCKRVRVFRRIAPLRYSFRIHMALGVIGPTVILLHSNFQLGSRNSTVALVSMLLVSASGFIGRFVYVRIHQGLYGGRRQLEDLRWEAEQSTGSVVAALVRAAPSLERPLDDFERWVADPTGAAPGRFFGFGQRARLLRSLAGRALADQPAEPRGRLLDGLDEFLEASRRVARFRGWERVFSLWHGVHLPLCFLLFGAAAAHVLAVHMY